MAMNDSSQPAPTRAMRLIFEYEGNQVRLVSQQPVEMAITGSDIAQVEQPGYYVDTRDARDRTLARVPARNAFSASVRFSPKSPASRFHGSTWRSHAELSLSSSRSRRTPITLA